jgi:hypothetical protein
MKVYIKNMVCQGTRNFVLLELKKLGINYSKFELGEIDLENDLSLEDIKKLDTSLRKYGLEIVFRKSKVVDKIRHAVHDLVMNDLTLRTSFSYYISDRLGYNYTYLNTYFKKETGIPIEEYYIEKKVEKMSLNKPIWAEALNSLEKSA